MADVLSKAEEFGPFATGLTSELSGHAIRIVGTFALGTDFQNNGNLVMSEENFLKVLPHRRGGDVGRHRDRHRRAPRGRRASTSRAPRVVQAALPEDVMVLTLPELAAKEQASGSASLPWGSSSTSAW